MIDPASPPPSAPAHPSGEPSDRLLDAKRSLLHGFRAPSSRSSPGSDGRAWADPLKDTIRDKPVVALGAAALLGFFLVRRDFFFKKVLSALFARLGMTAIKKVLK
ncbi:MAG: hypothetical protein AAGG38_11970 [Planctomycetota bacterium]